MSKIFGLKKLGLIIFITIIGTIIYLFGDLKKNFKYDFFKDIFYKIKFFSEKNFLKIFFILSIIIFFFILFYIKIQLQNIEYSKNSVLAISFVERIITELYYKKINTTEDPEIDIEDFIIKLSREFKQKEEYIRENFIKKIKSYIDENNSLVIQINFFINGKVKSFWKLRNIS